MLGWAAAQETFSTQLARLRFDLVVSLLATNFSQPPERAQALAQTAATAMAQTITWEQRERLAYLYDALQQRMRAKAAALGRAASEGPATLGFLELWGTSTLSDLWVIFEACRSAMTPRQRVVMSALYKSFFPDPIYLISMVYELSGGSPSPRPPARLAPPPPPTFVPV